MTLGSFSIALKMQIFLLFSVNIINKHSYVGEYFMQKDCQFPSRKSLEVLSLERT